MNYLIMPPKKPTKREKFFAWLKKKWSGFVCALNGHDFTIFGDGGPSTEQLNKGAQGFIEYLESAKCKRCGRKLHE